MLESLPFFVPPLIGGVLIGLAAALLMLTDGRIAGISGIVAGIGHGPPQERRWRSSFVAGLIGGGALLALTAPAAFTSTVAPTPAIVIAGLLVGFGTRLGSGCTSGHGVCGNARMSPRSFVATLSFIAAGMAVVGLIRAFGGY